MTTPQDAGVVEVKVPPLGESVTEAALGAWRCAEGDLVEADQPLVEIESEKATLEVTSPAPGMLARIRKKAGEAVTAGEVIAEIKPGIKNADPVSALPAAGSQGRKPASRGAPPSVRRLMAEEGIAPADVRGTGRGGRIQGVDVKRAVDNKSHARVVDPGSPRERERVVPMSPLRRTVAARLVEAQRTAAILTTFNEIDMSAVVASRERHQERFTALYGIKLGFMSFFAKAVVEALKAFPAVNSEVRGTDIVYKDHYDIGVAVGGGKGLVVPVVRDADRLSFAEIEQAIAALAGKAKDGTLTMQEMEGGTFTISNGGVYGSMLSTPILNPPQSGILGLHAIQRRPVAVAEEIALRPMMYVALSYDHRVIDGREAVQFLLRVKECVEEPTRILVEV